MTHTETNKPVEDMNTNEQNYKLEIDGEQDNIGDLTEGTTLEIPLEDDGMVMGDKWVVDTKEQGWEEEFDKRFGFLKTIVESRLMAREGYDDSVNYMNEMIDFIRETREQRAREVQEKIRINLLRSWDNAIDKDGRNAVWDVGNALDCTHLSDLT